MTGTTRAAGTAGSARRARTTRIAAAAALAIAAALAGAGCADAGVGNGNGDGSGSATQKQGSEETGEQAQTADGDLLYTAKATRCWVFDAYDASYLVVDYDVTASPDLSTTTTNTYSGMQCMAYTEDGEWLSRAELSQWTPRYIGNERMSGGETAPAQVAFNLNKVQGEERAVDTGSEVTIKLGLMTTEYADAGDMELASVVPGELEHVSSDIDVSVEVTSAVLGSPEHYYDDLLDIEYELTNNGDEDAYNGMLSFAAYQGDEELRQSDMLGGNGVDEVAPGESRAFSGTVRLRTLYGEGTGESTTDFDTPVRLVVTRFDGTPVMEQELPLAIY